MIRFLLSAVACAFVFTSCGPLEGGDPLDGPPARDGGSLHITGSPDSSSASGTMGMDSRYDRY